MQRFRLRFRHAVTGDQGTDMFSSSRGSDANMDSPRRTRAQSKSPTMLQRIARTESQFLLPTFAFAHGRFNIIRLALEMMRK